MKHTGNIATIFGGTGFIGRYVVRRLAQAGYTVKVAAPAPESAYFLRPCGRVGQVVPVACNFADDAAIAQLVAGSDIVINCIGVGKDRKKGGFHAAHVAIPESIARACARHGVRTFVHLSALGADRGKSRYAVSKRAGEDAVRIAFPAATILRPAFVFGPEDRFLNMVAHWARFVPALPLIGGGRTRLQPVYVADVAAAVMAALDPALQTTGQTYELGGPEILTLRALHERLFKATGRRRALVSVPFGLAKIAALFGGWLPTPFLTRDQIEFLKTDAVVSDGAAGFDALCYQPTSMALVLPHYMEHYRQGGRFSQQKDA